MSVSFSSLYRKVYFFLLLYFWITSISVKKIEKEAKSKYSNRGNGSCPYVDGRRSGGTLLSISTSLFFCPSFLSISLSPFSVKQSFNGLLFFLFHW